MTSATTRSHAHPTTTELLRIAGHGDQGAWEQLVRRLEPTIAAVVRSYRLQQADARDATQRTWLRLIEHHRQLREPEALAGWLATTARRECLRIVRDQQRLDPVDSATQPDAADASCDVEQRVVDADTARRVRRLVCKLPHRSGVLITALFEENPPAYAELSHRTGVPVGSIGPTRARALRQLRDLLDRELATQSELRCRGDCATQRWPAPCCARRSW